MTDRETRHWADRDVELVLEIGVEGNHQPTGRVCCPDCGACAQRPEDIEHDALCDEPDYTSRWDRRQRAGD